MKVLIGYKRGIIQVDVEEDEIENLLDQAYGEYLENEWGKCFSA